MNILRIVSNQIILNQGFLNKCRTLFKQVFKFLSKSIISNFVENLQLIKSVLNVTGPYEKVFSATKKFPVYFL